MPSAWLEGDEYHPLSHWFDLASVQTCEFELQDRLKRESDVQLICSMKAGTLVLKLHSQVKTSHFTEPRQASRFDSIYL